MPSRALDGARQSVAPGGGQIATAPSGVPVEFICSSSCGHRGRGYRAHEETSRHTHRSSACVRGVRGLRGRGADAGVRWKIYSEGMTGAPGGHTCLHAVDRNAPDFYQGPFMNGYATRHNPAPWFSSVVDKGTNESYCRQHSVDLTELWKDDQS